MTPPELEHKLTKARTQLIMDKPFLGALVLRLPFQVAPPQWCPTVATDARCLYYNPDYVQKLPVDQLQFVLAHEALHCAFSHFARRHHRQKKRWDCACDHAINPLLTADGLVPPPEITILPQYLGMVAEEIYPLLSEDSQDEPLDQHLYDSETTHSPEHNSPSSESGTAQPPPLTETERQNLETQWQQRLISAAQHALQAGKLTGPLARMIHHLSQPSIPWRMLLARYMTLTAREDYSYMRPSRREGTAIFPSLRSAQLNIAVGLDVSGSLKDPEIQEFLSEVQALKGQLRARILLLICDAQLTGIEHYEPWEEFSMPDQLSGGGGTSFKPVFEHLQKQGETPDLLIYFTDAKGEFPHLRPHYPVIWLVKGRAPVPWGERIQLN